MSLKSIIKKYCPFFLLKPLKYVKVAGSKCFAVMYEPLRRKRMHRIIAEAEKYVPYYQDELSLEILRAHEEYIMTKDDEGFFKIAVNEGWKDHQLADFIFSPYKKFSGIILVYDEESRELERQKILLSAVGWGSRFRLVKFQDYLNGYRVSYDDEYVVAVINDWNMARLSCMQRNMPQNIGRMIWSVREDQQYVDCLMPRDDEVILDIGAYWGDTALRFMKWGGDKIRHIYAFEFDPTNVVKCENNIEPYRDKITLIKKGAWDREQRLYIDARGTMGTKTNIKGTTEVQLTTIDGEVKNKPVTFIKMDIEGAEMKALMGAKNTIIKNRPRLAICIYHKPEDICEIPAYILSLVPEYKFLIRHYGSGHSETVLYAYCE